MDSLSEIENKDHFEKDYEMVIAVSAIEPETPVILQAPDEIKGIFDGLFCKDNAFYGVPDKPGVYNCTVNFEFHQGYFEGYRADGESDWSFTVKTAHLVAQEILSKFNTIYYYGTCVHPAIREDEEVYIIRKQDWEAIKSKWGIE